MEPHYKELFIISSNVYLRKALENVVQSADMGFNVHLSSEGSEYTNYSVIIIDVSCGAEIPRNINTLSIIRRNCSKSKVILIKSKLISLFFINQFACCDIDTSLNVFSNNLITLLNSLAGIYNCGNIQPRTLSVSHMMFLYMYIQGLSITDIAKEFQVSPKTIYSQKKTLWSKLQIHNDISIGYLSSNFKKYFESRHLDVLIDFKLQLVGNEVKKTDSLNN